MKTGSLGTHILFKKISASIFSSLLGNIDLMIFQIAFFFLGQNFIVQSSLASRKKTFMHPKQQNETILSKIVHSV